VLQAATEDEQAVDAARVQRLTRPPLETVSGKRIQEMKVVKRQPIRKAPGMFHSIRMAVGRSRAGGGVGLGVSGHRKPENT
jgi:hypothetical protein